jgi:hypothetical protein
MAVVSVPVQAKILQQLQHGRKFTKAHVTLDKTTLGGNPKYWDGNLHPSSLLAVMVCSEIIVYKLNFCQQNVTDSANVCSQKVF